MSILCEICFCNVIWYFVMRFKLFLDPDNDYIFVLSLRVRGKNRSSRHISVNAIKSDSIKHRRKWHKCGFTNKVFLFNQFKANTILLKITLSTIQQILCPLTLTDTILLHHTFQSWKALINKCFGMVVVGSFHQDSIRRYAISKSLNKILKILWNFRNLKNWLHDSLQRQHEGLDSW